MDTSGKSILSPSAGSACYQCGLATKVLLTRGPRHLCLPCASRTLPSTAASVPKGVPDASVTKAYQSRIRSIKNELPTLVEKASCLNNRIIALREELRNLNSQLNGTHGEATNEDDVVLPMSASLPLQVLLKKLQSLFSHETELCSWLNEKLDDIVREIGVARSQCRSALEVSSLLAAYDKFAQFLCEVERSRDATSNQLHVVRSALNGINGEATNLDDMQREPGTDLDWYSRAWRHFCAADFIPQRHYAEFALVRSKLPVLVTGRTTVRSVVVGGQHGFVVVPYVLPHWSFRDQCYLGAGLLLDDVNARPWFFLRTIALMFVVIVSLTFGRWSYITGRTFGLVPVLCSILGEVIGFFVFLSVYVALRVRSQLNGNNGEATNTDDMASALVSTKGAKDFKIDNLESSSRREEHVHASPATIRRVISAKPKIRYNTKKLRASAERLEQKQKMTERDVHRCEREFQKLVFALDPDTNIPQVGFNMGDILSGWVDHIPFVSACKEMAGNLNKTSATINKITDAIGTALPWLGFLLKTMSLVTTMGVCIYAVYTRRRNLALITSTLLLTYFTFTQVDVPDAVYNFLRARPKEIPVDILREPFDMGPNVPQGHDEAAIPVDQALVSRLIVAVFSAGFFSLGDKKKGAFDCLKDYVVHFPSILKGVDSIVEFSSRFVLKALNLVRSRAGLEAYDTLMDQRTPFVEWIRGTEKFLDRTGDHIPGYKPSAAVLGQVRAFIDEGREHTKFLKTLTDDNNAHARVASILTRLAALRDQLVSFNDNIVSYRPEPFCLYLYSIPGKGKSFWTDMMLDAYCKAVLSPEDFALYLRMKAAYVYNRTPETKFWDGYANQFITVFDDFLQALEQAGMDSAALDLIRCINGKPALLHMAKLNDKGSTYFTSELVILSSNMDVPQSAAVYANTAVMRRPDLYVELDFQDEFKKNTRFLGPSGQDKELLMLVNSFEDWDQRCAVYKLTTYNIDFSSKTRVPGPMITSREILNMMLSHRAMSEAKFKRVLPTQLVPRLPEARELMAKIMARQAEEVASRDAAEAARNKPQGRDDFDTLVAKIHTAKTEYSEFHDLLMDWCKLLSSRGPLDDFTREAKNKLEVCLDKCSISWTEFEHTFHGHIAVAENAWERLTPPPCTNASGPVELTKDMSNADYFAVFFDNCFSHLKKACSEIWLFFVSHWKIVTGVLIAAASAYALYRTLNSWHDDNEPQSLDVKRKPQVRARANFRQMFARVAPNQAQGSDKLQECMTKVLAHNYHICLSDTTDQAIGHIQMITDRVGVLQAHTVDMIAAKGRQGIDKVWLRKTGQKINVQSVPIEKFTRAHRSPEVFKLDLVMVLLDDCGIGLSTDFRKHIPTVKDWEGHSQCVVMVPSLPTTGETVTTVIDPRAYIDHPTGSYDFAHKNPDGSTISIDHYTNECNVSYFIKMQPGYCGLPVIGEGVGMSNYLFGSHKCYNGTYGGASPLVREWIDAEIDEIKRRFPHYRFIHHTDNIALKPPSTNFPQCYPAEVVGVVTPFHGATTSKLMQLPHAGMFELKSHPAVLDTVKIDGHYVNPYIKNRAKLPRILHHYPSVPKLNPLVSHIINTLPVPDASDVQNWKRRMTVEEALYGIAGTPFSSLDMSTSVGYPKVLSGFTSKLAYLGKPGERSPAQQARYDAFLVEIAHLEEKLRSGERPTFLHMDVLKDELRPDEKVATASTRVVIPSPLALLVLCRMYFGGFAMWTQINKINNGITIGMNPYSQEWHAMCLDLFKTAFQAFGGDSEGFDLNQHQEPLRAIFLAINDWYADPIDNGVRLILSLDFMHPRHVAFPVKVAAAVRKQLLEEPLPPVVTDVSSYLKIVNSSDFAEIAFVYVTLAGHPSGSFLTALINSWYSLIKPYILLLYLTKDYALVIRVFQARMIRSMTLGDDFITSVHPDLQNTINAQSFASFSALYGMRVTNEDKTAITSPFPSDQTKLMFLKRTLRYEPECGRYVGALAIPAIVNMMCWMRKSKHRLPTDQEIRNSMTTALCELSLWGREVFDEWSPKVHQAASLTLHGNFVAGLETWDMAIDVALNLQDGYRP